MFGLGLRLWPQPCARMLSNPHPPSLKAEPLAHPFHGVASPMCTAEGDQGPLPPGLIQITLLPAFLPTHHFHSSPASFLSCFLLPRVLITIPRSLLVLHLNFQTSRKQSWLPPVSVQPAGHVRANQVPPAPVLDKNGSGGPTGYVSEPSRTWYSRFSRIVTSL